MAAIESADNGRDVIRAHTLVLVGLMGAGKTTVGRRLGQALSMPFVDSDAEVERAAGCSITDIFELHGEAAFRDGERRVIRRLLDGPPKVLATGGGAFVNPETRALIRESAISIWLRADINLLVERVSRRDTRPLLRNADPVLIMKRLMAERYPLYNEADVIVDTDERPHGQVVSAIINAVQDLIAHRRNQTPVPSPAE